jgi:hypothetical protein
VPYLAQTLAPSVLFQAITVLEDTVHSPETPTVSSSTPNEDPVATPTACLAQTCSSPPSISIDCAAFRITVPIGFDAATLRGILSIMRTLP